MVWCLSCDFVEPLVAVVSEKNCSWYKVWTISVTVELKSLEYKNYFFPLV